LIGSSVVVADHGTSFSMDMDNLGRVRAGKYPDGPISTSRSRTRGVQSGGMVRENPAKSPRNRSILGDKHDSSCFIAAVFETLLVLLRGFGTGCFRVLAAV
jgi:hypothetical protein